MSVTADTRVRDLLEAYPYLLDWLVGYNDEFSRLRNPVYYNTLARAATLKQAAGLARVPLETFLDDTRTQIARHEIIAEEAADAGAGRAVAPGITEAERERRQEALKAIIRRLHDGASVDEVKAEFDVLAAEVDSYEIAQMEQALIAEGMPVEEVQRLCDVHVTVFKEALEEQPEAQVEQGHPVDAYQRENVRIGELTVALRSSLDTLAAATGADAHAEALAAVAPRLEDLAQIDVHYLRKENQLFPVLEAHGVEGPTKVMWALDDDIRGRIRTARALVGSGDAAALLATLPETLSMIDDMVYKEEKILLPTALQVVTDEEWSAMAAGDAEIGYAWIEGPEGDAARVAAAAAAPGAGGSAGPMLLPLPTGALSLEQLDVLFRALPFDVTYVDEHDRVRFYSEGDRVFPRSPAAVGREVRNCHPPKSVDKVVQILEAFKLGTQDVAEFWIELGGRFVWIRYFALRDADGAYRGCLEVVQDATHVRALEGQRRLLDW